MIIKKKRFKPAYKKFIALNANIQDKLKIRNFKKKKWEKLLFRLSKISKTRKIRARNLKSRRWKKYNSYYKFYNQISFTMSKFKFFFKKMFKRNLLDRKKFKLFFGYLKQRYLKRISKLSYLKSNKVNNVYNSKLFFIKYLECRLDVIMLRSCFVLSIRNARQLISHKHVLVNNKIIKKCSYLLKKGDKITFNPKIHRLIRYYSAFSNFWPFPPKFLQVSFKNLNIFMVDNVNNINHYNHQMNINRIISLYKR